MKKILLPLLAALSVAGCVGATNFTKDSVEKDQRLANIYFTASNSSQCGDRSYLENNTITILDNIARLRDDPKVMSVYSREVHQLSVSATNFLSDQRRGVLTQSSCMVYLDSIATQVYNLAELKDD